jgi:O-antigen ligase
VIDQRVRAGLLSLLAVSLPLGIAVQQTALALATTFLVYTCWHERHVPRSPLDRPLVLCLGALLLSTLASPDVTNSLRGYGRLWLVAAFFAAYHLVRERHEVERLVTVMVLAAVTVAAYSVVQHFTGVDLARGIVGKAPDLDLVGSSPAMYRAQGLHPSGITYAHNLLFPLTFATAWLSTATSWRRCVTLLAGWLVMVLALIFSFTRGVWVAFAVVLVMIGALRGRRHALVAAAVLGALAFAVVSLGPAVQRRAVSTFDVAANLGRSQIWRANVDMIAQRPLLGWGYGNYKRFRTPFYARYPSADTTAHAHNDFLQVWVDSGLVGLGAFLYLCWVVVGDARWTYRRLPAAAEPFKSLVLGGVLAVIGFLVGGLTQYNFGDAEVVIVFWFTAGLLMRAGRLTAAEARS